MNQLQSVTTWDGVFSCSFSILTESLHDFLRRLRSGETRPLAFGFGEAVEEFTYIDFEEEQHDDGAIFLIRLVRYNPRTKNERISNLGVFLIYKSEVNNTRMVLRCPLSTNTLNVDDTVEIAKQFANEARGHGVPVQHQPLTTDFTRNLILSIKIEELITLFSTLNEDLKAFGYWIEIPEEISGNVSRTAFIILKTDGTSPQFMLSRSSWWRREVGAIECLQVRDRTQLKIYASNFNERSHLWAYINNVSDKLQEFGLITAAKITDIEQDPLLIARDEIRDFKSFVERQAYSDVFVNNKPQENIARALLQAFLPKRSYREIPVRGGQSDLLLFTKEGRFLYETKIWKGPKYYTQGLREIGEYIIGENSDEELLGIFYIIFDPTKSRRAEAYLGRVFSTEVVYNRIVNLIVVNLTLPQPSKKS